MSLEDIGVRVVRMEKVAKSLGVKLSPNTKKVCDEDASVELAFVKVQLYSAWLGLKGERLKRAAVSLLESLASLALEDNKFVGHWGNCLAYLDAGLTALQALSGTNYLWSLEHLSKTRVTIFHVRKWSSPTSGLFEIPEIQHKQSAQARG